MNWDDLNDLNTVLQEKTDAAYIYGANMVFQMNKIDKVITTPDVAIELLYAFVQELLDNEQYAEAATVLLGRDKFDARPKCSQIVFKNAFRTNRLCIPGASSMSKCLGPDVPVMMYDGTIKKAKEIKVGDVLMGDDNKPRNVLQANAGYGKLYKIIPARGEPWICNSDHILSLKCTINKKCGSGVISSNYTKGNVIDINIEDYLKKSKTFKHHYKQFKVPVELPEKEVPFDPRIYGLWLGDGTRDVPGITVVEEPIKKYWTEYFEKIGYKVSISSSEGKADQIFARLKEGQRGKGRPNLFTDFVRSSKINGEKRILPEYLYNSRKVRLELLAGLIDSDGNIHGSSIAITTKYEGLKNDILYLCNTLGYSPTAYLRDTPYNGEIRKYWKIHIGGDFSELKTFRKNPPSRSRAGGVDSTSFEVEEIGDGDYYGFVIDGNHRFLLGDCTVTHNTFSLGIWLLMDYIRDPHYTKIRVCAVTARHLETNLFADLIDGIESMVLDFGLETKSLHIGLKGDTKENNCISGILFPQDSSKSSGRFKGLKPTRRPKNDRNFKQFGGLGRVRLLMDECFPAGTLVDGKPIELYEVGDQIRSYNETTGQIELAKVTNTMIHHKDELFEVKTSKSTIVCTGNHPFLTQKGWVNAQDLNGEKIRYFDNCGNIEWVDATVTKKETLETTPVYNLTVEPNNTYLVDNHVVHNCQQLPLGVKLDLSSIEASLSGTERIKIFAPGNPEDQNHWWGKLCEPEKGFESIDLDSDFQFKSKSGWDVVRLDGMMSENVQTKKDIYLGIQTWTGFKSFLEKGDNSPEYYTFGRGWFPASGSVNTIIKRVHLTKNVAEVLFADGFTNVGAVDLASRHDKTVMAFGRWGLAHGLRYKNGMTEMFTTQSSEQRPRHMFQLMNMIEIDCQDSVDLYKKIIDVCETLGIEPNWLAVDSTGMGDVIYDLLRNYFGNVMGIQWGSAATDLKITAENKQLPSETYDGIVSEMWFATQQWFENGFIKIHPSCPDERLFRELTTRRIPASSRGKTGKLRVESKAEYKKRGNDSPDYADSAVMVQQLLRSRSNILPSIVNNGQSQFNSHNRELPPSIYDIKSLNYNPKQQSNKRKLPWE